ncbi:MAG: HAMP domain-containing sensor histidine kinase [Myxococcota bacterium]
MSETGDQHTARASPQNREPSTFFESAWMQRLVDVRTDSHAARRRGGMLVVFCVMAGMLTLALFFDHASRDAGALSTSLYFCGFVFYVIAGVVAKRGYVDVAGLLATLLISVLALIYPFVTGRVSSGLIFTFAALVGASVSIRPKLIWVVVALNAVGYVGVASILPKTLEETLPQGMGNYLFDLGILNLGIGFVCWLNASFSEYLFEQLERASKAVEDSYTEEQEAKLAKELAERANQTKSQFLANISHELRTPLNAILGYSEIITEDAHADTLDAADVLTDLARIQQSGRQLLSLIDDLLDLSKIEAGHAVLHVESFALKPFIEELSAPAQLAADVRQNTFLVELHEAPAALSTDRGKLRQILANLLSNAVKFTQDGAVTLTVRSGPSDTVVFEVRDTGIGMSEEALGRIFEDFVQAEPSISVTFGGTGLGLGLVRRLTEALGGEVRVESALGEGSAFVVRVPVELSVKRSEHVAAP